MYFIILIILSNFPPNISMNNSNTFSKTLSIVKRIRGGIKELGPIVDKLLSVTISNMHISVEQFKELL